MNLNCLNGGVYCGRFARPRPFPRRRAMEALRQCSFCEKSTRFDQEPAVMLTRTEHARTRTRTKTRTRTSFLQCTRTCKDFTFYSHFVISTYPQSRNDSKCNVHDKCSSVQSLAKQGIITDCPICPMSIYTQ